MLSGKAGTHNEGYYHGNKSNNVVVINQTNKTYIELNAAIDEAIKEGYVVGAKVRRNFGNVLEVGKIINHLRTLDLAWNKQKQQFDCITVEWPASFNIANSLIFNYHYSDLTVKDATC
jgi:hypothetical protein